MAKQFMTLTVNGERHEVAASPRYSLLDVIRGPLGLKGTKEGCTTGSCGVCTVNNGNGEAILSCLTPALEWDRKEIVTIEGLEREGDLAPIQKAFVEYHAVQCGYCTPGVIMSARGVLETFGEPSPDEINEGMAGVFCRCTGHIKVKEAIREVKEFMDVPDASGGEGAQ